MRLCLTPPVFTAVKNRWRLRALATLVAALAAVVVTARRADAHWCDSGGALTFVEQMICGDQNLIGQDHELNRLYKRLGGRKNISLKTEQREWLRSRNACADPDCLRWHYDERLRALGAMRNSAGAGHTNRPRVIPEKTNACVFHATNFPKPIPDGDLRKTPVASSFPPFL